MLYAIVRIVQRLVLIVMLSGTGTYPQYVYLFISRDENNGNPKLTTKKVSFIDHKSHNTNKSSIFICCTWSTDIYFAWKLDRIQIDSEKHKKTNLYDVAKMDNRHSQQQKQILSLANTF